MKKLEELSVLVYVYDVGSACDGNWTESNAIRVLGIWMQLCSLRIL
jgi:hypothetical protein